MTLPSLRRRAALMAAFVASAALVTAAAHVVTNRARPFIGLAQAIFPNPDFAGPPLLERQTTALDVDFVRADPDLPNRQMSVRWEGFWFLPVGGPVRVFVMADDEVRLWLDDELIADRHVTRGYLTHVEPTLLPGLHRLRVEYVQHGGGMALDVRWAPFEHDGRPFAAERLFVSRPDDATVVAAARVMTLRAVEPVAWALAAGAAIVLVVVPGCVSTWRLLRRRTWPGWLRHGVANVGRSPRLQHGAVIAAGAAALAWALAHRLGALNPMTLWADDIWVAALASRPSLFEALGTPAPVPPGFLFLQWMARHVASEPGLALQVLPLTYALVGAVVLAIVAARVTRSRALGLVALALALLDPFMAQVSVFSKQYTMDGLVAVLLLGLAVRAVDGRRVPLWAAALFGVVALLFSFPSVFVSVAVVHVLAWRAFARETEWTRRRWSLGVVAIFDLVMLATYWLVLRVRVSPRMNASWARSFLPTDDVDAGIDFVASRGVSIATQALPDSLAVLAPLAVLGFAWLLIRRELRAAGTVLLLTYVSLLGAAALGVYPIGMGYEGRVVLFSDPLVLFLITVAVHALTSWLPWRVVPNVAVATAALVFLARAPAVVTYFDHDHSFFVDALEARAQPGDAIILNDRASFLLGVYTNWPAEIVRSRTPEQFYLRFTRPLTLTLPSGAEGDGSKLGDLEATLADARPERVFFFSTRRETALIARAIEAAGYRPAEARASTTSTLLAMYERADPPADEDGERGPRRSPAG